MLLESCSAHALEVLEVLLLRLWRLTTGSAVSQYLVSNEFTLTLSISSYYPIITLMNTSQTPMLPLLRPELLTLTTLASHTPRLQHARIRLNTFRVVPALLGNPP